MATACLIAMGAFTAAMFVVPLDRVEALADIAIFFTLLAVVSYLFIWVQRYMNRNGGK